LDLILDVASWLLLGSGAVVLVLGAVAILRMPNFFTRIHAASVNETLGPGLILLGLALQSLDRPDVLVKLVLVLVFLVLTGPVASHALGKAAIEHGIRPEGYDALETAEPKGGSPSSV
ncbi:MAG: monovalent cation/H(+) antiporter subunit G, partial [Acidobacteriota bacterium]